MKVGKDEVYLLTEALVLPLQLHGVELTFFEAECGLTQALDGALQTLVLLLQLQKPTGCGFVHLNHK